MKINSITPITANFVAKRTTYNTPSFGEKACVPGDEFQLSVLSMVDNNPKELLKRVKKAGKDVGYVDALFSAVLESRREELFLKQKAAEKAKIEWDIQNAYNMYRSTDLTSSNASFLSGAVTDRINELESKLKEYDQYRSADENRLKILGKVAKELVKKDGFNPNEKNDIGYTLVERAIRNNDDELSLMIIKHKNFKKPTMDRMLYFESKKFLELEEKAKSWF